MKFHCSRRSDAAAFADMISRIACASLLLLWLVSAAAAEEPSAGCKRKSIATGDRLERTLGVGGVERSYILDVPAHLTPERPVPLLLDFHGFGHSAAGVWRVSGFRELGMREGFVTAYPQGLPVHLLGREDAGWEMTIDGNRDVAFAAALIDKLEEEYCIDPQRIFVTGFSNGAFLSHVLGCRMADRIAAIAPVSGGSLDLPCNPPRAVSVIIFHGRNDAIVEVSSGRKLFEEWKKLDRCRGETREEGAVCTRANQCRDRTSVVYCEGDGEHRWPPEATERIWQFFKTHPLLSP